MPLSKDDAPKNAAKETAVAPVAQPAVNQPVGMTEPLENKGPQSKETKAAIEDAIDAGAGAPAPERAAAEALPEGDVVKDAIKRSLLAEDAQTEAKEKVKVVDDSSVGAEDTPSGFALKKTAGISDDVKRGEEYSRIKSAKRWGYVPASEKDLK